MTSLVRRTTKWFPYSIRGQIIASAFIAALLLIIYREAGWTFVSGGGGLARRSISEQLQRIRQAGLSEAITHFRPSTVGISSWSIGEFAEYNYKRHSSASPWMAIIPERVVVEVIGQSDSNHALCQLNGMVEDREYWLRFVGMGGWRDVKGDTYRLVVPDDLRVSARTPAFSCIPGYFPISNRITGDVELPASTLRQIDSEMVQTRVGMVECTHAYVTVGGEENNVLEVWLNPLVRPLGIVRARSAIDTIELQAFGTRTPAPAATEMATVVEGRSTYARGCESCHQSECHELRKQPL